MITRIRLRNWKSHQDTELKFSGGVNALIGIMGSGKTSVMDAISFAFFGTFPGLRSRRTDLDSIIMNRPKKMERAQIELEFTLDEQEYYIKRSVARGKGTEEAEIQRNGKVLNVNARGVTDEVIRCLQMDYDLFSKAIYSEQNGIDYFLRIPRGKRKGEIDRMLKVDRFENARSEAVSMRNTVRARRESVIKTLSDMRQEGIEGRIKETLSVIEKLENEKATLAGIMEGLARERAGLERSIKEAEKTEKERNRLQSMLSAAKAGLAEASESEARIRKAMGEESIETMRIRAETMEKELSGISAKLKEAEAEIDQHRSCLSEVNGKIAALKEGMMELKKADARCPVCDNDLSGKRKQEIMEHREKELEVLRKRAGEFAKLISESSSSRDSLMSKRLDSESRFERIRAAVGQAQGIQELVSRKKEYEERIGGLDKAIEELSARIDGSGISRLRERMERLVADESEARTKSSSIEERVRDKTRALEELLKRQSVVERYEKDSERDEALAGCLEGFEKALKVTQDQLREEFLKAVNSVLTDVWGELYPYEDFQDIRMAIEDDYILQLRGQGEWISVEGTISGGERSMAALALRIAFSMAFLPNLKWLILDEPTHNLDSNAIRQLSRVLREKMESFAEQVFLITHEEGISEGVTGMMYKLERDKSKDEPTRIGA